MGVTLSRLQGSGEGRGSLIAGIIVLVADDLRQSADQGTIIAAGIRMGVTFQFFPGAGHGAFYGIAAVGMGMGCHLGLCAEQILRFCVAGLKAMSMRYGFGNRTEQILLSSITGVQMGVLTSLFHCAEKLTALLYKASLPVNMRLLPAGFIVNVLLELGQGTDQFAILVIAMAAMGMQHKISVAADQLAVFSVAFICMFMDP